jgi:hypothetical protein
VESTNVEVKCAENTQRNRLDRKGEKTIIAKEEKRPEGAEHARNLDAETG